eukprot:168191-Hanusia_phi.AAC.1
MLPLAEQPALEDVEGTWVSHTPGRNGGLARAGRGCRGFKLPPGEPASLSESRRGAAPPRILSRAPRAGIVGPGWC